MSDAVESTHAPFAPSSFKRKKVCPGSHLAEKPYPEKSSEAAIDGTHTHTLVETCLIHGKQASDYVGQKLIDHEGEFTIDKDRADRAQMALTYVNNQVTASGFPVFVTPEQKVNPGTLLFRDDWYGTADITMLFADTPEGEIVQSNQIKWIVVTDYKDGAKPVDPFENYQGISYMLGVIAEYVPPMDTSITFVVIQPKTGGIKEWETTVGELMEKWLPDCQQIITDAETPGAPFHADEEQCHYCLHKLDCVERQSSAVNGINTAMGGVDVFATTTENVPAPVVDFTAEQTTSPGLMAPVTSLPVITEMTDEDLSQVMMLAPIIRGWLKDLDEHALERVKQGGTIPHFKMVQKNGRRSWLPDHPSIIKSILSMTASGKRIFKKDDIVEEKLISFAKILGNASLSAKQKTRIEKEFIKQPTGQKTLVIETEKGKDISPAALLKDMPDVEMQTGETSQ